MNTVLCLSAIIYFNIFLSIDGMKTYQGPLSIISRNGRAISDSLAKCYANDDSESWYSGANDILVVKQSDGSLKSTPLQLRVGKLTNFWTTLKSREGKKGRFFVNNNEVLAHDTIEFILGKSGEVMIYNKTTGSISCVLYNQELKRMKLRKGRNNARLIFDDLGHEQTLNIYLFDQHTQLVITDIDGTITKSDFKGLLAKLFEYDHHHDGVIELFDAISKNGYVLIYISAISQCADELTKKYLFKQLQNVGGYSLPRSPLFMSPVTWHEALLLQDKATNKLSTLRSITDLFDLKENVIVGAYGNKATDTKAYLNAGIDPNKIFCVNEDGNMIDVATETSTSYFRHFRNVSDMYPKYPSFQ